MATCNICVEKLNKSTRLEIKCNYCEFSHCRTCFQKYLLETNEPYCMNCKKIYSNDFIFENCTDVFITKELKKHRQEVLLNQQKSLMPATQPYVVLEKEKNKMRERVRIIEQERSEILRQLTIKQTQINNMNYEINHMTIHGNHNGTQNTESAERKKFIRKCPMTDCRGFLSQQWKCGTCETRICNKCNEEKLDTECDLEGNHRCDPGNVANMELINKDTKPCPECGTMIHRYVGCPMMFCVECHCAWNWNTGLVEKGVIHNPHYYEFMRRGGNLNPGRNHGDIPCGGLPEIYGLRRVFDQCSRMKILNANEINRLYNIHNCITHVQHHEILIINDLNEESTRHLRVQYMLNNSSENDFKQILQQLEKQKNKKRDFNNIFQMFVDVSSDIFRQIVICYESGTHDIPILKNCFDQNFVIFDNLRIYFIEQLKKCGKSYKCVYPGINESYTWEFNYERYLQRLRRNQEIQPTITQVN